MKKPITTSANKLAQAVQTVRSAGMLSHPRDSVLAYITPGQKQQLEMQDGHVGQTDPLTGIEHHDDGGSDSGDSSDGGPGGGDSTSEDSGNSQQGTDTQGADNDPGGPGNDSSNDHTDDQNSFDDGSMSNTGAFNGPGGYAGGAVDNDGRGDNAVSGRSDTAFGFGGEFSGIGQNGQVSGDPDGFASWSWDPNTGWSYSVPGALDENSDNRETARAALLGIINEGKDPTQQQNIAIDENDPSGTSNMGPSHAGLTAEQAAKANAEYESVFGEAPNAGRDASEIGNAYTGYVSDMNHAGLLGGVLGTTYDVMNGMNKGAAFGPLGSVVGGVFGGFTGKNGDKGAQLGRDAVAESLNNGSWNTTSNYGDNSSSDSGTAAAGDAGSSAPSGSIASQAQAPTTGSNSLLQATGGLSHLPYNAFSYFMPPAQAAAAQKLRMQQAGAQLMPNAAPPPAITTNQGFDETGGLHTVYDAQGNIISPVSGNKVATAIGGA